VASPRTSTGTGRSSAAPPPADAAPAARRDGWLSDVLGFEVFAVEGVPALPPAPGRVLEVARVPAADVSRLQALLEARFAVVDVNVTLERRAAAAAQPPSPPVERARPEDGPALLSLAARAFRYSRFHLDPLIDREAADRVKREWVRSYLEGRRGVELLVSHGERAPVGFLAVLESGEVRVIDLVAVEPAARRQGAGDALVAAFLAGAAPGQEVRVGTQVANVPSLRLYEKHGFRTTEASYVLHRHSGR
jgi:ribosomal protein S18 acetylase RimI-like enzyme